MNIHGSTAKEILFSRTCPAKVPGQNYSFPGQSIQKLKVINQHMREKAHHIYSMMSGYQIQGHFQELENEFVIFQGFQDAWEP